jgi:DNA adenine methylase
MTGKLYSDYLTAEQIADRLGYTVQHTRLLFREGKLPAVKFGRDWLVHRNSLDVYLADREAGAEERLHGMQAERGQLRIPGIVPPPRDERGTDQQPIACAVNVSQVPQRSPFRYPGGKTWLVPYVRAWLRREGNPLPELIEPFAGGGIVSLTAIFENLAAHATLVELDEDVGAVWQTILNGRGPWLAEQIARFEPSPESVQRMLADQEGSLEHRAFATIVKNRVARGGIMAPGAGVFKRGENDRGLTSRWYPDTLRRRILEIVEHKDEMTFIQGDGIEVLKANVHRTDCAFFIDPPYTVAGRRLYKHSEIDHETLFATVGTLSGDFLMTYDNADEIRALASKHGFATRLIAMKTTHHTAKQELMIGKTLDWLSAS